MRLDNIEIADEGTYSCEAIEQDGTLTVLISELLVRVQPTTGPIVQVQFDPPTSSMSEVPLNTTVTFTCTSTGGRPPATLGWSLTESGTTVSANPTYTSSNNSQGVGDATSTFNFTTTKYGVTYRVQCTASGPDPIQSSTSAITSFTTEKGGLSTGTQAGIGVGVAIGCMALAGVAAYFFVVKRKKRPGRDKDDADTRDPSLLIDIMKTWHIRAKGWRHNHPETKVTTTTTKFPWKPATQRPHHPSPVVTTRS
uniref:Ig-like domain-containing protein n=1 Tax=Branchiostoma floridae TaxID=7739 RepID=C3Z128_BRAFL|eukprot:XP_002597715.1 hypothetical protein BRAFLDRAFT_77379 [Branchiostoma floridae]